MNPPIDNIRLESKFDFGETVFFLRDNTIKNGKIVGVFMNKMQGEPTQTRLVVKCKNHDYDPEYNEEYYNSEVDEDYCYYKPEEVISGITIES